MVQIATGALSDRTGRKPLIVGGMWIQAAGIALVTLASSVAGFVVAVVLLVITLLLYREDTRNRLIRLAGRGRLTVTTRALDEAGQRLGGYLLGHSAVNAGFGEKSMCTMPRFAFKSLATWLRQLVLRKLYWKAAFTYG